MTTPTDNAAGRPAEPPVTLEKSILLQRLLSALFGRKWTILVMFFVTVIAVCFFTWLITPTWTGTATVVLEGKPKSQFNLYDDLATASPPTPGDATVQNLVAILGSESMADTVVTEFDLAAAAQKKAENPGGPRDKIKKKMTDVAFFPIHKLQEMGILADDKSWQDTAVDDFLKDWLNVGVMEGSQVISVSVDAPSIELSQNIPNRMVELLEERLIEFRKQELQVPYGLIEAEANVVQSELDAARQAVHEFKDSRGVLDLEEVRTTRIRNLEDLKIQLASAKDDAETIRLKNESVQDQLDDHPKTVVSSVTEEVNPALAVMRDQLASMEVERAGLSARRTPEDKTYQVLEKQIEELRNRMMAEKELTLKSRTEAPDPTYQSLLTRAAALETDAYAASARVDGLQRTIDTLEEQMETMGADEMALADLEQDVTILTAIASNLRKKKREMETTLENPLGEISMRVTPAINWEFAKADWPIWPLNVLVALFLATALGLGWPLFSEFWKDAFVIPAEAEGTLGIPTVGRVAPLRPWSGKAKAFRAPKPKVADTLRQTATSLLAHGPADRPTLLVQLGDRSTDGLSEHLTPYLVGERVPQTIAVLGSSSTIKGYPGPHKVLPPLATLLDPDHELDLAAGANFIPIEDSLDPSIFDAEAMGDLFQRLQADSRLVVIGPLEASHPLVRSVLDQTSAVWTLEAGRTRRATAIASLDRLDPSRRHSHGLLFVSYRPRVPRFVSRLFRFDEAS